MAVRDEADPTDLLLHLWLIPCADITVPVQKPDHTERRVRFIHMSMLSTIGVALSYVAAIVAANAVAFFLRSVGSPLSWFQHEFHALLAFAPPALAAIVGVQLFVHSLAERTRRPYLEYTSFTGATVFYTLLLLLMNFYGLGSAHVMFIATLSYYVPVLINDLSLIGLKRIGEGVNPDARMHLATYFVHLILPIPRPPRPPHGPHGYRRACGSRDSVARRRSCDTRRWVCPGAVPSVWACIHAEGNLCFAGSFLHHDGAFCREGRERL